MVAGAETPACRAVLHQERLVTLLFLVANQHLAFTIMGVHFQAANEATCLVVIRNGHS